MSLETELSSAWGMHGEDWSQGGLTLRPALEGRLGEHTDLVLSGRVRVTFDDALDGQVRDLAAYDKASRPAFERPVSLELRDAYLERSIGAGHLRIGKQQIVWGALDGLKLLDALNPQSFRSFILDDFDESRISQWGALLAWPIAGGELELAIIPDQSVHELPAAETTFALTAERFAFGLRDARLAPALAGLRRAGGRDRDLRSGGVTWGSRYSRFAGGWDLAISYQQGLDHQPIGQLQARGSGAAELVLAHRQRRVLGFAASKSFGALALRTELAWRPGRSFNRVAVDGDNPARLTRVRRDHWGLALGLDWQAPADLFVSVQLLKESIADHDVDIVTPRSDLLATAVLRRSFRYETVTAELRWYGNLADGDGMLRPGLSLALGDSTRIALGADLFYGDRDGLFGQFDREDRLTVALTRFF